ncbi:ATP-binding protein [Streptomyces sp. NPDC006739]|uniref:ATP-binding protein n=1 Tax=Streptomyces sp. NPDC006739 TaxID=3364763 RepID=UPI0036A10F0C
MCYSAAWTNSAARPQDARRALRAFLVHVPRTGRALLPQHVVLDAELIVSELITNPVRHAPGPCGRTLRLCGNELAITVWDTSTEEPEFKRPDPHRVGGHGLPLVRAASNRVSVTRRPPGKQITAHLLLTDDNAGTSTIHRTVLRAPLAQKKHPTRTEPGN